MEVPIVFVLVLFWFQVLQTDCQDCEPVNCITGQWQEWSGCSASCGDGGVQKREREVLQKAECHGECEGTTEENPCERKCCPVDCTYTPWSEWDNCYCVDTCDEPGSRNLCHRLRSKVEKADCGGFCDDTKTDKKCSDLCCYQDCVMSEWQDWSSCNAQCEQKGANNRTRTITQEAKCGGKECELHYQYESCKGDCCPIDCVLGDWSEWSNCQGQCEKSRHFQQRHISFPECGGINCTDFNTHQEKKCKDEEYNVDCQVK